MIFFLFFFFFWGGGGGDGDGFAGGEWGEVKLCWGDIIMNSSRLSEDLHFQKKDHIFNDLGFEKDLYLFYFLINTLAKLS